MHLSPFDASVLRLTAANNTIVIPPEGGQVFGMAARLNNGDSLSGWLAAMRFFFTAPAPIAST